MAKYRRLSILLDKQTSDLLHIHALKKGISKAKLIINWIHTTNKARESGNSSNNKKTVNFNFRIQESDYKKLQQIVLRSRLNISEVVRSLIFLNLVNQNPNQNLRHIKFTESNSENEINDLWLKGRLNEINNLYFNKIDQLSINNLITYICSASELGNLDDAYEGLNILQGKAQHVDQNLKNKINLTSKILTTDIKLCKREVNSIENEFEEIDYNQKTIHLERGSIGLYYIQKGEMASYREDFQNAKLYLEKSLETFDIKNFPTFIIRAYIRLAKIYMQELDESMAKKYLVRAGEISKMIGNEFLEAWVGSDESLIDLNSQRFAEAKDKVIKAIHIGKVQNSAKEVYYAMDHYARIIFKEGDEHQSYKIFAQAEKQERRFRAENKFSTTSLYKYYIESKYNYEEALRKIKEHNYKTENHQQVSFGNYILNLAMLNDSTDRDEGVAGLRRLYDTTRNLQIKEASIKSIQKRELIFIR